MERPLQTPNLPVRPVRRVFASLDAEAAGTLRTMGISVLRPVPGPGLPGEERTHADLLLCHAGGGALALAPSQVSLVPQLELLGFLPRLASEPGGKYPENVLLNFAVCSGFAFGNFRYCDPALLSLLQAGGKTPVSVRQGYAKCAVCFVSGTAAITEDAGLAAALAGAGFDVLRIAPGDVFLSDRHYGFFGGAAGLIAPDLLAVNGSLSANGNGREIRAFLQKHGVRACELHGGAVTDIGGILPLTEDADV